MARAKGSTSVSMERLQAGSQQQIRDEGGWRSRDDAYRAATTHSWRTERPEGKHICGLHKLQRQQHHAVAVYTRSIALYKQPIGSLHYCKSTASSRLALRITVRAPGAADSFTRSAECASCASLKLCHTPGCNNLSRVNTLKRPPAASETGWKIDNFLFQNL